MVGVQAYRLVRRAGEPAPPRLADPVQEHVIDHTDGPLLVLGGPGTGKTDHAGRGGRRAGRRRASTRNGSWC